jgi:hypothetical protein
MPDGSGQVLLGGCRGVAKSDYERMLEQFRSQIEDVWSKRKVDQMRSQVDDLRGSVDDLVKNYNRVMSTGADLMGETQRRLTSQVREMADEATSGITTGGFSWWIPVLVLGAIGAGYWLYNMLNVNQPEARPQPHANNPAGFAPPMSSTEMPFSEQR